jgi:hypothetical protein
MQKWELAPLTALRYSAADGTIQTTALSPHDSEQVLQASFITMDEAASNIKLFKQALT